MDIFEQYRATGKISLEDLESRACTEGRCIGATVGRYPRLCRKPLAYSTRMAIRHKVAYLRSDLKGPKDVYDLEERLEDIASGALCQGNHTRGLTNQYKGIVDALRRSIAVEPTTSDVPPSAPPPCENTFEREAAGKESLPRQSRPYTYTYTFTFKRGTSPHAETRPGAGQNGPSGSQDNHKPPKQEGAEVPPPKPSRLKPDPQPQGDTRNARTESFNLRAFKASVRKDWYALLGVPRTAGKMEIKQAYKKNILVYHPDKVKGDADDSLEMTQFLNQAKDVLLDPDQRRTYDLENRFR